MMEMKQVKSSNINAIGYDADARELHLEFHGGRVHIYSDVNADVHEAMLKADSIGKFFHSNINRSYLSRPKDVKKEVQQ
jgi:hypothetical protein